MKRSQINFKIFPSKLNSQVGNNSQQITCEKFRKKIKCEKPFSCKICQRPFAFMGNLVVHIQKHLNKEAERNNKGAKNISCYFCQQIFSTPQMLNIHMTEHTRETRFLKNKSSKIPLWKCYFCQCLFTHSATYNNHMATHTLEKICSKKPFKCNFCSKKFRQKVNKITHEIAIHTKKFKHFCFSCVPKKRFAKSSDLKRHIDSIHLGIKFNCPKCNKKFTTKWYFNRHIRENHDDYNSC